MGSSFFKRIFVCLVAAIILAPRVSMAAGTTGATFLNVDVSAASAGMGGAYTAIANDASAVTINPAGMTQIKGSQVALMHNENFADMNQEYVAYVNNDGKRALGAALVYFDYGSMIGTTVSNTVTGFFTPKSYSLSLAYAAKYSKTISYGVALKYVKTDISIYSGSTVALDAGVMYKPEKSPFTLAAMVSNIGQGLTIYQLRDSLPLTLKLAGSYKVENMPLLVATDLYLIKGEDAEEHIGLQYTVADIVPVRIGWTNQTKDISNGFSFGIGLIQPQYSLDYAYIPTENLDDTHRLSVLFNF